VGVLSVFYHDDLDIDNADHRMQAAIRLIAKNAYFGGHVL
jgi:hypothetical protein